MREKRMIVTLSNKEQMYKTILPEKVTGRYWIKDIHNNKKRNLICVEAIDGKWIAKSNKLAKFYDGDNNYIKSVEIKDESVFLLSMENDEKSLLFSNVYSGSGKKFVKLLVPENKEITIGRNEDNVICYINKFVSGLHVIIKRSGDTWTVQDMNSTNGSYVNNIRVKLKTLLPGDVLSIMGMRIIIGSNFIAINNPNYQVVWNSDVLTEYVPPVFEAKKDEETIESTYFYRSPRLRRKSEPLILNVYPPTQRQDEDKVPMAMVVGPSLTMGLGSASTGIFSIINGISRGSEWSQIAPTAIMSFTMLCGMLLWPTITRHFEKKNKIKRENKRQEKYREYLMEIRDKIAKETALQTEILSENNVSLTECENIIMLPKRNLWERQMEQDDFLELRVGMGSVPLRAKMEFPKRAFSIDEDVLQDDLEALAKEQKILKNVPITFSLIENNVSGIIGENEELVTQFTKGLIIRIAATHSYDEVKLMVITDEDNKELEFTKWLPHIWNNDRTIRYYADNENDAKEMFSVIDKIIDSYTQDTTKNVGQFFVVINASRKLSKNSDTIKRLSVEGIHYGFVIINVCDELRNLPKECSKIIEISENESKIYDKNDISGACQYFDADIKLIYDACEVSRSLSRIRLDLSSQSGNLPGMLTFLDMYNVGKIEYLNCLTRWKENNPIVTLKAPVGVDSNGNLFNLDLHEKFQGPHGLVAGMTGSGKSEFIITYILSMAVNYHPDEVSFILIDYKGGGLAGAFEDKEKGIKLPHLAGTITNLDGSAVKRSLVSIQSELRKRQAIFNEARKISNEGTIDIYKYQKLYRDGVVKTPIPHLFIISDEFAELKSQQPEFMQQLISAARIGRSLGVHLILATQKPSGVVDDQIWSNSRFRVCLKVQEKSDSMDMIKRPDAAELALTGRFYLQVGFNEFFDIGQSAWCGAPYVPSDAIKKEEIPSIQVIDNLGRIEREVKLADANAGASNMKQIVGIVNYLSELAKGENINVTPLWLDEIPEVIYLKDIIKKYCYQRSVSYELEAVIGEYDDPFNQSQNMLGLSFTEKGNTVVYGNSGSGKEIFISTIIYGLCNGYSPEELNIYIMDFGAETLQMFSKAPQVGDIVFSADEEKVYRLMTLLREILNENKRLLAENGGNLEMYYKNTGEPLKNTVVIINNFAAMYELYEDVFDELAYLTREGNKYGIYFLFTATTATEIKYKVLQNCGQHYVLQMNDKNDYLSVLGSVGGVYPSPKTGRGIFKSSEVYEFQTARICCDEELHNVVEESCKEWTAKYHGVRAIKIPIVPETITTERYAGNINGLSAIPIGIDIDTVKDLYFDFGNSVMTVVSGREFKRLKPFINGVKKLIRELEDVTLGELNQNTTEEEVVKLFRLMVERNNNYKDTGDNTGYRHHIYFVEKPMQLFEKLSADGKDKLSALIYKCEKEYNVHFVVCDDAAGLKEYQSANWFKNHFDAESYVWIGDGFDEQYLLKTNLVSKELRGLKNTTGLVCIDGESHKTKIIMDKEEVQI